MNNPAQAIFAEMFPVRLDSVPRLSAYRLTLRGGDASTVGGKLTYQLKKTFPGHWAWAANRIITDSPREVSEIMDVVSTLWMKQPEIYSPLKSVAKDTNWTPSNDAIASFVARGLLTDSDRQIRAALEPWKYDLGSAYIERLHDFRGWVVQGQPAVSISITSRLVHKQDVMTYAAMHAPEELIGLQVADKTSTLKGEIASIVGPVAYERARLLALTKREEVLDLIAAADDDELVVDVASGRNSYDYVIGALRIIIRTEDFRRFKINSRNVLGQLRLDPELRAKFVTDVSNSIQGGYLEKAYQSPKVPQLFVTTPASTAIRFGDNTSKAYSSNTLLSDLEKHGLYHRASHFESGAPITVALVNTLSSDRVTSYWTQIALKLRALGFNSQVIETIDVKPPSRVALERAISRLEEKQPDIILGCFPDQYRDDDDDDAYYHFKSLTVGRGIPSQVIEQSTLDKPAALGNIVLGIIGKTGNIPYVLAEPFSFADMIVGIDIAREKKKRLAGSMNATAITRIYLGNGGLLKYTIHDAPLEGETVPPSVLQSLFPASVFSGKRTVIHRDGYFRGDEKETLRQWAKKIGAEFYLVEIIKSGAPRLYRSADGIVSPLKGQALLLSEHEAILVSSPPPFGGSTPNPLQIRTEAPLTIHQAIKSVLSMTVLHYGSLLPPRLPVTIHYSDKMAYMALRGIKPKNLEGDTPFWL